MLKSLKTMCAVSWSLRHTLATPHFQCQDYVLISWFAKIVGTKSGIF